MDLSDDEWKKRLTPEQYAVLRQKGTEAPFSGQWLKNQETGMYTCAGCGSGLFTSTGKYDTSSLGLAGWPSFSDVSKSDAVELIDDNSWGMHRVEVVCKNCGGHLGHVFDDESSPTGQHYCINSCALDFKPENGGK